MAAELRLTKIVPSDGDNINLEGNLIVGTDLVPKAVDISGNLTVDSNITGSGDLDITGDISATNVSVTDTPTLDTHLITKGYLNDVTMMPQGYIYGLEIANGGTPDEQIDIAAGTCKDSTNTITLTLSAGTTIDITDAGAGGLDTGTVANDTWYYIWLIYSTSTGLTDAMFSTSATSPTMPSGYDYKRRIRGAVLTDGTADIITFNQKDNMFTFTSPFQDVAELNPGTSRVLATVSIPPNMIGQFILSALGGGVTYAWLRAVNQTDIVPSLTDFDVTGGGSYNTITKFVESDENSQIAYRTDVGTNDIHIFTHGFIDPAQD